MALILLDRDLRGFRYRDRTIGGEEGKSRILLVVDVVVVVKYNRIVLSVVVAVAVAVAVVVVVEYNRTVTAAVVENNGIVVEVVKNNRIVAAVVVEYNRILEEDGKQ